VVKTYGSQSMVGRLRRVVVRRPDEAMANADPTRWHYSEPVDLDSARSAHEELVAVLESEGAEVIWHDEPLPELSDAVFVYDPSLVTDAGAVILRMGKQLRRGEEDAAARLYERLGVPVLGRLESEAHAEGGDTMWLDHDTLAVGIGFRTNREAARQLAALLGPMGVDVVEFELPFYTGPTACLHLLSLVSPVDVDLAVAYPPLMPVPFWKELRRRGIRLLEVPEEEFRRWQGTNVLALAPRRVVMLDRNPATRQLLEDAGCTVSTIPGGPLSFKAEGGPTCLTRPILRDDL
jgi:dimethylargininase